jgi:hypothetical protein
VPPHGLALSRNDMRDVSLGGIAVRVT